MLASTTETQAPYVCSLPPGFYIEHAPVVVRVVFEGPDDKRLIRVRLRQNSETGRVLQDSGIQVWGCGEHSIQLTLNQLVPGLMQVVPTVQFMQQTPESRAMQFSRFELDGTYEF